MDSIEYSVVIVVNLCSMFLPLKQIVCDCSFRQTGKDALLNQKGPNADFCSNFEMNVMISTENDI